MSNASGKTARQTPAPSTVKTRGASKTSERMAAARKAKTPAPVVKATRVKKAPAAPVHSCEAKGIHARGLCKSCYRKQRLAGAFKKPEPVVVKRGRKPAVAQPVAVATTRKGATRKAA